MVKLVTFTSPETDLPGKVVDSLLCGMMVFSKVTLNVQLTHGLFNFRFYDKRDAEDALEAMDGRMLDGRELRVQMARYGRPTSPQTRRNGGGRRDRDRRRSSRDRRRSRSRSRGRRSFSRSRSRSESKSSRGRSASPVHKKASASRSRSKGRSVSRSASRSNSRD